MEMMDGFGNLYSSPFSRYLITLIMLIESIYFYSSTCQSKISDYSNSVDRIHLFLFLHYTGQSKKAAFVRVGYVWPLPLGQKFQLLTDALVIWCKP